MRPPPRAAEKRGGAFQQSAHDDGQFPFHATPESTAMVLPKSKVPARCAWSRAVQKLSQIIIGQRPYLLLQGHRCTKDGKQT
jgi:hypothetical protein